MVLIVIPKMGQILTHLIKGLMVPTVSLTIFRHKCHRKFLCMEMNNTHRLGSIQTTQFMDYRWEEINQYTLGILITIFNIMLLQYLRKVIAPIKMRLCLMHSNLQEIHFSIKFIVLCACIISFFFVLCNILWYFFIKILFLILYIALSCYILSTLLILVSNDLVHLLSKVFNLCIST